MTALALFAPAFRLFRMVRFLRHARLARGLNLVKVVGAANRVMNTLRRGLRRRGLGYAFALSVVVCLLGAAGIFAFESAANVAGGFTSFGDALWWTAMILTTMGTDYWPHTNEGRVLCFLLALYSFAIFGYITASVAAFFLDDVSPKRSNETITLADLRQEIAQVKVQIAAQTRDEDGSRA